MQWAVRVNEAYQRLKDPLKRAAYLCERRGAPIDAESNTAMPRDFLMQQMAWREALDEARDERGRSQALSRAGRRSTNATLLQPLAAAARRAQRLRRGGRSRCAR